MIRTAKLTGKQWLLVFLFALLLVVLREFTPSIFAGVWNVLILLLAILSSSFITKEKYYPIYALVAVVAGAGVHWFYYVRAIETEKCDKSVAEGFINYIKDMDSCLDYSEAWVLYAQSLLLAGALTLVVALILEIQKIFHFFKHDY